MSEQDSHLNEASWKDDPRLNHMDPEKLHFLEEYAERIRRLPNEKRLSILLSLPAEAGRRGISFSDSETMLLVAVFSTDLTPSQKQQIRLLQKISKTMAARSS
jgi:hypothetical protein